MKKIRESVAQYYILLVYILFNLVDIHKSLAKPTQHLHTNSFFLQYPI